MSTKELRGITPIFQTALIKEIGKAMDAIDEGDLFKAYSILKTLAGSLKKKDKDALKQNEIAHIEKELSDVSRWRSSDFYQTDLVRNSKRDRILRENIRPLFEKIMEILHEGGYLELRRRPVDTNVPPGFFAR